MGWMLTEEINKNVMKQNILKILTTLKKDGGIFKIDSDELTTLMQIISEDAKKTRESRNEKLSRIMGSGLKKGVESSTSTPSDQNSSEASEPTEHQSIGT